MVTSVRDLTPFSAADDNICRAVRVPIVLARLGDASDPSGNSINLSLIFLSNVPIILSREEVSVKSRESIFLIVGIVSISDITNRQTRSMIFSLPWCQDIFCKSFGKHMNRCGIPGWRERERPDARTLGSLRWPYLFAWSPSVRFGVLIWLRRTDHKVTAWMGARWEISVDIVSGRPTANDPSDP